MMNITQYARIAAVCISAACVQTAYAGDTTTTAKQQGTVRVENKMKDHSLVVMHGTQRYTVTTGKTQDLPMDGKDVLLSLPDAIGRIDRVTLQTNPEKCEVTQCLIAQ